MNIIPYKAGIKFKPGMVVSNVPNEVYHKKGTAEGYYGHSLLGKLHRSFEAFELAVKDTAVQETTLALERGTALHLHMESLIKREEFSNRVFAFDGKTIPSKKWVEGKASVADVGENAVLPPQVVHEVKTMAKHLYNACIDHGMISGDDGHSELSFFWEEPVQKGLDTVFIKLRARPDYIRPNVSGSKMWFEWKTSRQHQQRDLENDMVYFDYDMQLWMFARAWEACGGEPVDLEEDYMFLPTILNSPPFEVAANKLWGVDLGFLEIGRVKLRHCLERLVAGAGNIDIGYLKPPYWASQRYSEGEEL